jgi:hypothetical protein
VALAGAPRAVAALLALAALAPEHPQPQRVSLKGKQAVNCSSAAANSWTC